MPPKLNKKRKHNEMFNELNDIEKHLDDEEYL